MTALSECITAIQEVGRSYDALAESQSVESIRDPKNKGKQEAAMRYVAIADSLKEKTGEIINLVRKYWPENVKC